MGGGTTPGVYKNGGGDYYKKKKVFGERGKILRNGEKRGGCGK